MRAIIEVTVKDKFVSIKFLKSFHRIITSFFKKSISQKGSEIYGK